MSLELGFKCWMRYNQVERGSCWSPMGGVPSGIISEHLILYLEGHWSSPAIATPLISALPPSHKHSCLLTAPVSQLDIVTMPLPLSPSSLMLGHMRTPTKEAELMSFPHVSCSIATAITHTGDGDGPLHRCAAHLLLVLCIAWLCSCSVLWHLEFPRVLQSLSLGLGINSLKMRFKDNKRDTSLKMLLLCYQPTITSDLCSTLSIFIMCSTGGGWFEIGNIIPNWFENLSLGWSWVSGTLITLFM